MMIPYQRLLYGPALAAVSNFCCFPTVFTFKFFTAEEQLDL